MPKTKFEEFVQEYEHRRVFEQESLAFEATEMICTLLKQEGIPRAELAKRIGKSKAYVTQVLSGARNMTLHTFADFAFALGHKVDIRAVQANPAAHQTLTYKAPVPIRGSYAHSWAADWQIPTGEGAFSALPAVCEPFSETAHAA